MHKVFYFILVLIPFFHKHLVFCEDFTEICRHNQIIKPVQGFCINKVVVLFLTIYGQTKVVRIKLNDEELSLTNISRIEHIWPKPNSDAIELWPNWNKDNNNKIWTELNDIISVFKLDMESSNSLIFTTTDPEYSVNYLIGYNVTFNSNINSIESVNKFYIDPYRLDRNDELNLKSLFAQFPNDFADRATPVVAYQLPQTKSKRVFVYYKEINPRNPTESEYKVHFLAHNFTSNQWNYDESNAGCIRKINSNYLVKAAFDVSYKMSESNVELNILELYNNGKYGALKLLVQKSGVLNREVFNSTMKYFDIRDIICLKSTQPPTQPSPIQTLIISSEPQKILDTTHATITTTSGRTISPTIDTFTDEISSKSKTESSNIDGTTKLLAILSPMMIETTFDEQSSKWTTKSSNKSPLIKTIKSNTWWIWVVVILALLIGASVIGLYFYLYRRIPEDKNIEMRERAAQEGVADETDTVIV